MWNVSVTYDWRVTCTQRKGESSSSSINDVTIMSLFITSSCLVMGYHGITTVRDTF